MTQKQNNYFWSKNLASFLVITGGIAFSLGDVTFAQNLITPDKTLGNESSFVEKFNSTSDLIKGGAVRDTNLFHSFLEFNIGQGKNAFFVSPNNNIQNIVARVTGNNTSNIQGMLGVFTSINGQNSISNANLFLINPNGIIFGLDASINIGGSFVASTASGIQFADGTIFRSTNTQAPPLLTVTTPIGLQFGNKIGDIFVQGTFINLASGKTLALVGGNINLDAEAGINAELKVENGQIALGGLLEPGIVGLNLDNKNLPLSFPESSTLANISLNNFSRVNVNGEGGGHIQLQGKSITLTGASFVSADTTGNQNGRGIAIQSEQLTLKDGSQIRSSSLKRSTGNAGNLTINASSFVQVTGTDASGLPSGLFAETFSQGDAGNLTIETSKLIVEDGANIAATARERSQGLGGILKITAVDLIKLSGTNNITGDPSGLFAQTLGTNDAGSLNINTQQLIVQNGAVVTAGTGDGSRGNGGNLTVNADSIELSGTSPNGQISSGLFVRSRGTGNAGSLNIVTRNLTVRNNATVTVESLGSGNAGNLNIQARSVRLDNQGKITAATTSGQGGNISLQNLDLLLLQDKSQIITDADTARVGADVAGGNINIDSKLIVATPGENSDITANAFRGRGGNINITTDGLFNIAPRDRLTLQNDITAASDLGINGKIQINTPDVQPSKGIVALPENVFDASQAIAKACSDLANSQRSEIVVTGRGGLPPTPDEPLSSDVVWSDTRLNPTSNQAHRSNQTTTQLKYSPRTLEIVPASGWIFNQQGEVTLIASQANVTNHNLTSNNSSCLKNNSGI